MSFLKTVASGLIFLSVCGVTVYFVQYFKSPAYTLKRWGVQLSIPDRTKNYVNFQRDPSTNQEQIIIEYSSMRIVLDRIFKEHPDKLLRDRQLMVESLFEPMTNPYPEVLSSVVVCDDEFKPRKLTISNGIYYVLFADERRNFGICARDLVRYNALYGIVNCKEKGVFEIRIFEDLLHHEGELLMQSFSC